MKIGDVLLVTSYEYDPIFTELTDLLLSCSRSHGDCVKCLLLDQCRQAYDSLCDKRTHNRLKPEDIDEFREKFFGLYKQLTLVQIS